MASQLRDMVDKKVLVVTCDGRIICGLLKGFDRQTNLILASSQERLYSLEAGVEIVYLGLYVLRGTNVSIAGEVDLDADRKIDFPSVRGESINPVVH
jgi:U6 snRNA-associated Sm-like protein LSm8